jgi:hypothetical protein
MSRDDIQIMLQRIANYQKPDLYDLRNGGGVWDAYIRMKDIKEFYESPDQLSSQTVEGVLWNGQFEIKDLNGTCCIW